MNGATKRTIAIGAIAATAAVGGGVAVAASSNNDPRSAFFDNVAKRLNVSSDQLTAALKGAYLDQLEQAVKDGRLTQSQADAIKKNVERAAVPFGIGGPIGPGPLGRGGYHRHGPHPHAVRGSFLSAAARYLGMTQNELRTDLRSGKSLAEVAKAKGKATDGLVDAIVAAEKKQLDEAVTDKRLTGEQRDAIVKDLPARIKALVEGGPPPMKHGPGDGRWEARPGSSRIGIPAPLPDAVV